MHFQYISRFFSSRLLLPSLLFFGLNFTYSYRFHQVNSFKLFVFLIGITIIACRNIPFLPSVVEDKIPWKTWGILFIPVIATFPGYFYFGGSYNYNFRYELVTNLLLIAWVVFLYRGTRKESDLTFFLKIIGLTVIYVSVWALLEKFGYDPLNPSHRIVKMVKSTFGHRNYFSGFLIILLPLLLVLSIPDKLSSINSIKKFRKSFQAQNILYISAFLLGSVALLLAQTRAAIVACLVAIILVTYLSVLLFASEKWQSRIKKLLLLGILFSSVTAIILFVFSGAIQNTWIYENYIKSSRFFALFTIEAWLGRILPWETSWRSIMASPWIGFGLGSSYNLFFSFVDPESRLFHHERSYNHAHSEFMEYLQESGLVGLIALALFWGWMFFQLYKILKDSTASKTSRKLAIAISGGFIAYLIHAAVSVAPRMIVMKLPLFTLFALVFLLVKFNTNRNQLLETTHKTLSQKLIIGLPTIVIIASAWSLYLPWAAQQWIFKGIESQRPSMINAEKLKNTMVYSSDIYALDYLSHLQIEYNQPKELEKTIRKIEHTIPHYREVGHSKAIMGMMMGKPQLAKKWALEFQQRDKYHTPSIHFLLFVAAKTGDKDLFFQQFAQMFKKQVFGGKLVKSQNSGDVQIEQKRMKQALSIEQQNGILKFYWNEKLILDLFNLTRSNIQTRKINPQLKKEYGNYLAKMMLSRPFFKMKILGKTQKKDADAIRSAANTYFSRQNRYQRQKREIMVASQNQIKRSPRSEHTALVKKRSKNLARLESSYQQNQQQVLEILKEKTNWKPFMDKRKFVQNFVNELLKITFSSF